MSSGIGMGVVFGSMVQNGKFLASAIDFWAMALKSVDLPTLGKPTRATFTFMERTLVEYDGLLYCGVLMMPVGGIDGVKVDHA